MANQTDEELEKALRDSGFRQDPSDPNDTFYRVTENGVEKRYTNDNYSRSSDNNEWEKHHSGKRY